MVLARAPSWINNGVEGRQNYDVLVDPVDILFHKITHARHMILSRIVMGVVQCWLGQ